MVDVTVLRPVPGENKWVSGEHVFSELPRMGEYVVLPGAQDTAAPTLDSRYRVVAVVHDSAHKPPVSEVYLIPCDFDSEVLGKYV